MTTEDRIRSELHSFILSGFLPGEDPATLADSTPLVSSGILTSGSTADQVSSVSSLIDFRGLNRSTLDASRTQSSRYSLGSPPTNVSRNSVGRHDARASSVLLHSRELR